MKLIGLDVGTKRIGVAKADSATKIAVPNGVVQVNGQEFAEIARIAKLNKTSTFVMGLPRNNEGAETKQSEYVRQFARELAMSIPNTNIYFQDESLTSVEAERRLKERKKGYQKGDIDAEAASIILQDFLERLITNGRPDTKPYTSEDAKKENDSQNNSEKVIKKVAKSKKDKHKLGTVLGAVFGSIVLLGAVLGGLAYFWYTYSLKPVNVKECKFKTPEEAALSEESEEIEECRYVHFKVSNDESVAIISKNLKDANLIKSDLAMKIYTKLSGTASDIKAGEYQLRSTMSTADIVDVFIKGVADDNVFNITFLPGETVADIKKKLEKQGYTAEEIKIAFEKQYDHPILKGLYGENGNLSSSAQPIAVQLEGYIFGDTYQFYNGESIDKIIVTTLDALENVVKKNDLEAKFKAQGLSLREGIILASIVQKEARAADMKGVAQVFINRVRVGMMLGSDVTATYAADLVDPMRKKLVSNYDIIRYKSPYNTRVSAGLTPGPISNPGLNALLAVADPDSSKKSMYYFLTGDDGKMYYSDTEAGHNQNIRKYCRILCNVAL